MNIAPRVEQAGAPGRINVSEDAAKEVRDFFACDYRGTQKIKHWRKGHVFPQKDLPELSDDELGYFPNKRFNELFATGSSAVFRQRISPFFPYPCATISDLEMEDPHDGRE